MHAFDSDDEKTDTAEKLDRLTARFSDPTIDLTPQYRAEAKAFWRALSLFCPESVRAEMKEEFDAGKTSAAVVGARLGIPEKYADEMLQDRFERIVRNMLVG